MNCIVQSIMTNGPTIDPCAVAVTCSPLLAAALAVKMIKPNPKRKPASRVLSDFIALAAGHLLQTHYLYTHMNEL